MKSWLMMEYVMTFLLFGIWSIVYVTANNLYKSGTTDNIRSNLRKLHYWLWPAIIMTGVKFTAIGVLWNRDWAFVEDKVLIQLPLYMFSIAAIFFFSLPALNKRTLTTFQPTMGSSSGGQLTGPIMLIPFAAAYTASVCTCLQMLFFSQSPLRFESLCIIWLGFAILVGIQWHFLVKSYRDQEMIPKRNMKQRLIHISLKSLLITAVSSIFAIISMFSSQLPDRMSMMDHGGEGNHSHAMRHLASDAPSISVDSLKGPQTETPDRTFTLSAQKMEHVLPSGESEEVWAFNQLIPGPELRVKEGELVEVKLVNIDVDDGVTIHWHGLNVPNGEDGVAGLTQDAVLPGEQHIYRFAADQTGTYWYHSHQQSSVQVAKGLYGVLIVEPQDVQPLEDIDLAVMSHPRGTSNGTTMTLGALGELQRKIVKPGQTVRLRLINANNMPKVFYLSGVPYKVIAIDGVDLHGPEWITDQNLLLAAGGRYDISFLMPEHAVSLAHSLGVLNKQSEAIVFAANARDLPHPGQEGPTFNPAKYGTPAPTPFQADTIYDRSFTLVLDNRVGFYNGTMTNVQTINGYVFPNTPSLMVREGDVVKMKFVNRGFMDHPMHLHGHHILVLQRNGEPVQGSPWWTDTLNVAPGETYDVAFVADNPGLWMDHCHNLDHAAAGMSMHLMYEGVYTPYEIGSATVNLPE